MRRLLLAIALAGCTHDFDEFAAASPSDASIVDARADQASPRDASPAVDSSVEGGSPADVGVPPQETSCVPDATCIKNAGTCKTTCDQTQQTCINNCNNNNCRNTCRTDGDDCRTGCETACTSCTTAHGCTSATTCANASK